MSTTGTAGPRTFHYAWTHDGTFRAGRHQAGLAPYEVPGGTGGRPFAAAFADSGDSNTPWPDRLAGRRLFGALLPGDVVVVSDLDEVAPTSAAVEAVANLVLDRGVELHVTRLSGYPGRTTGPFVIDRRTAPVVLAAARGWRRASRADRSRAARAGIAARMAAGYRHTNCPGYGFRWAGRRGRQRRVADEYEQAVMRHITECRAAGMSWHKIAVHLMRHQVVTAAGRSGRPPVSAGRTSPGVRKRQK